MTGSATSTAGAVLRNWMLRVAMVAFALAAGWCGLAVAGIDPASGVSDPALRGLLAAPASNESLRVILRLADGDNAGRAGTGFARFERFPHLSLAAAEATAAQLVEALASGLIVGASLDRTLVAVEDSSGQAVAAELGPIPGGLDGRGVTVGIMASGLGPADDLGFPLRGLPAEDAGSAMRATRLDFVDGMRLDERAADPVGLGSAMAGIITGASGYDRTVGGRHVVSGVASGAGLVSFRVLDSDGVGSVSDVLRALDWAIANRERHNLRVLALAVGQPVVESWHTDPLCIAVNAAWQAGIVVVATTGHLAGDAPGPASVPSPANSPYVITTGALAPPWTLPACAAGEGCGGAEGPSPLDGVIKPDLVAPGSRVMSLTRGDASFDAMVVENRGGRTHRRVRPAPGSSYVRLTGRSVSAALVAAAAAILLEAHPDLGPDAVKARLMHSARPTGDDVVEVGSGALDLAKALDDASLVQGPALSPSAEHAADGSWQVSPTASDSTASLAWWSRETLYTP